MSNRKQAYNSQARRRAILEACFRDRSNGGTNERKISTSLDDSRLIRAMILDKVIKADMGSGGKGFVNLLSLTDAGKAELGPMEDADAFAKIRSLDYRV